MKVGFTFGLGVEEMNEKRKADKPMKIATTKTNL